MTLTAVHWIYAFFTLVVIVTMLFRRGVVIPTLVGTLLVGWVFKGSFVGGLQAVFNANLVAAKELFSIFLIIMFMVALLHSLKDLGADTKMIAPIEKIMMNGHVAYFVLVGITFVISLFFWPTPAVPLICALLVPAAIRAGLPAMGAAMAVAMAGQGMALSSDYVMQIAPMLSAKAAGIETAAVADKALVLSLITGGIAICLSYAKLRRQIREPQHADNLRELDTLRNPDADVQTANEIATTSETEKSGQVVYVASKWGKAFAVLVPVSMLIVMIYMIQTKISGGRMGGFEGGDGAAFIGGVAAVLLIAASLAYGKMRALDKISDHITEGFVFAFRAMGPVVPIAGFFFLGSGDFTGSILSLGEDAAKPAFLFDLVQTAQNAIPQSAFLTAFGILIIGIITGLDGSGFSGLPLTGALSGALGPGAGIDPSTLAAIGQMGAVWAGGGTIVAWSSLIAVAGFCGVNVLELARRNFFPVIVGLIAATIIALLIW
ncbi:membrane protein [Bacillaceae bacterium]